MAALGRTERAAFLSRVLGYERLRDAQERVREVRNALAAEVRGLEAGLPDAAGLAGERRGAPGGGPPAPRGGGGGGGDGPPGGAAPPPAKTRPARKGGGGPRR